MTLLKLCGTTSVEDARLAGRACADFCGILVDVEWSERSLTIPQARDAASGLRNVILLCGPSAAFTKEVAVTLRPYALQLLCQEPPPLVA
jgi:phosphoribosylanthranilate isomerase